MESEEEVHSDDGSFELVNSDDYASDKDNHNMSDGSYDFLCSEVSETLVLDTEELDSKTDSDKNPLKEIATFYSDLEDMEFKTGNCSDAAKREAKGDVEFKGASSSDAPKEADSVPAKEVEKVDVGFKDASDYDPIKEEESEKDLKSATDCDPVVKEVGGAEIDIDSTEDEEMQDRDIENALVPFVQPNTIKINKGRKRSLMDMIYDNSNIDFNEFPAHLMLKQDIRDVAKNHITRYLPAKSLARSRLVCKEWNRWISSPFFAHLQSQYFRKTSGFFQDDCPIRFISSSNPAYGVPHPSLSFFPVEVTIRSSCNGLLLCQAVYGDKAYYVCNPATKQWTRLPDSSYYHGEEPRIVLAFEPSSLNFGPCYQVLCAFSLPDPLQGPIVYFDMYDSVTQSWKVSDMVCVDLDQSDVKGGGIFVDGIVYWETLGCELLAFDLKNEIYGVQKLPFVGGGGLVKIFGEICYVNAHYHHPMRSCILDVYGGSVMSLRKTMYIKVSLGDIEDGELLNCSVVPNSSDDAVVGVIVENSGGRKYLYVHRVKDQRTQGPCFLLGSKNLFAYVNSLANLNA
uniref:uncharacterized protein LOC122604047 n=1 Tax=Erigeron canadensis TaxID=72917 RepID=UPI001CB8CD82|nr:uncharacterized protein LOC122604047 [Erigeron canadensis]